MKQNLEQIVNNPKYKLILTYPYMVGSSMQIDSIKGWVSDEFATALSASYESLFSSGFIGDKVMASLEYLNNGLLEKVFGSAGAMRVKSVHQTVSFWAGSSSPDWSVTFAVPRLKMSEPPVPQRVRTLQKAVIPDRVGSKIIFPWRPKKSFADNPDAPPPGTSTLELGEWLILQGLLLTNVSVTFSKEVVKDGTPLYALVNVSFVPWRYQFASDLDRWYS